MSSNSVGAQQSIPLSEGYELDLSPRRLRRGSHTLKLERIPLEILLLLVEHRGQIVSREEIVARVWGNDVFLDTDNSIRGAIRKVRRALKDDPETPRFIQTVTGRGYRFIAPVISPAEEEAPDLPKLALAGEQIQISQLDTSVQSRSLPVADEQQTLMEPSDDQRNRGARIWPSMALASLAVISLLAVVAFLRSRGVSSQSSDPQRKVVLAVLPFDNLSRDPDQEFFSEGLTEEMIAQLGKLNRDRLTVIARSSVAKYKGSSLTAREIGRELNADYLVQGSVRQSAPRVRITVQLIRAQDQTDLWTESYDRELKDLLEVQDSVVRSVATQIHIALTDEQRARLANPPPRPPEAYVAYLKGRYYWNKRTADSMEKGATYFQQAIDRDPTFAAAYSGLADCNSGLTWHGFKAPADSLPRAFAAARKAVEIDPQSAEAHASLGLVHNHRWEWDGAEAEFKRALELDPQYANAHHWYADYLSMQGQHDEALAEARRALELDPLNLMVGTWVGLRYYLAHNYQAAIEQNRNTVELDSNFAAAHLALGEDYIQAGLRTEAVNELKTAASLSGGSPLYTAQVAVALAAAGQNRDALHIAQQLERLSRDRYVSPYGLAQIYASLHDQEHTFQWLQIAYDDRAVWMGYLGVDPIFDRYRSHPRFQELLRRVGLP